MALLGPFFQLVNAAKCQTTREERASRECTEGKAKECPEQNWKREKRGSETIEVGHVLGKHPGNSFPCKDVSDVVAVFVINLMARL